MATIIIKDDDGFGAYVILLSDATTIPTVP